MIGLPRERFLARSLRIFGEWRYSLGAKRDEKKRLACIAEKKLRDSKRHYFWGKARPDQFDPDYEKTATRMYLNEERTQIFLEAQMYDHEDSRLYEDSASFSFQDYRRALQELKDNGRSVITNSDSGASLSLKLSGDGAVITLEGGHMNISSTPGGAMRSSTPVISISLKKLHNFPEELPDTTV